MISGSPFDPADLDRAAEVLDRLRSRRWRLVTAESCTGGLAAGLLTAVPGSSDVLDGGWVTYSNTAKSRCLGVPAPLLAEHGAVAAPVARAMAEGALAAAGVELAVSATGVAGPGGGTAEKPVGLVFTGLAAAGQPTTVQRLELAGDRGTIRLATVRHLFDRIIAACG